MLVLMGILCSAQTFTVGKQTITYNDPARSNRAVQIEFRYPGTNQAVANGEFPFVVFAHGFQMDQTPYYPYSDSLAIRGYIVALLMTETSLSPSHANFAQDLIFVHNRLISESTNNPASPFFGKVIPKSAFGGHSMGGGSTVLSSQYSNPAECYFTFAAATTNPSSITAAPNMTKPYLAFSGSRDCIASYSTNQLPMYNASGSSCKFMINIKDGLHCQFNAANSACSFGEGFSGCASSPLSRTAQINKTLFYLIPFLDYYLKGNCAAWTLFENRYATNTVDSMIRSCTNIVPEYADVSGNTTFCAGSTETLTANPAGFNYTWSTAETTSSINITTGGNYAVTVDNGTCSLASPAITVIVNQPPILNGNITGTDTLCTNQLASINYTISPATNATAYNWSYPNSWTVNGASNSNDISLSPNSSGTLSVAASNQCGVSGAVSLNVVVADTPTAIITQNGNVLEASQGESYVWYLNGQEIPFATSSGIIPQQSGDYQVAVTNEYGCTSMSGIFSFVITSAVNINAAQISIFPNPAYTYLYIQGLSIDSIVTLYDLTGRIMLHNYTLHNEPLFVGDVPNGFYHLSIQTGGERILHKILIQH